MHVEHVTFSGETARERVAELRQRGICYQCYDLQSGGAVFGAQDVIYEDEQVRIVLETTPRMQGHTIVVFKPHRDDMLALNDAEAGYFFAICVRCAKAIRESLGAEKVYLNTMCDGGVNHLHAQLFPRYLGDPIGSKRFVAPRGVLADGAETANRIRAALLAGGPLPLLDTGR